MLAESQKTNKAEMKRTFLEPAIKKINEKTPLKVSHKTLEDGKFPFSVLDKFLTSGYWLKFKLPHFPKF